LDKRTEGTRQEKEVTKPEFNNDGREIINIPILEARVKTVEEIFDAMEKHKKNGLQILAHLNKSFYVSNKKFLPYFKNLINISYEAQREALLAGFAVEFLNEKVDLLEKAIAVLVSRTKSLNEKDMKEQGKIEKEQKELDGILEQMDMQKKKETIEAFQKIDKIRQDLLRDAIV